MVASSGATVKSKLEPSKFRAIISRETLISGGYIMHGQYHCFLACPVAGVQVLIALLLNQVLQLGRRLVKVIDGDGARVVPMKILEHPKNAAG